MFKIGIIGSDNSHALVFSKLVNTPDAKSGNLPYPDMKITHIFGVEEKKTKDVAAEGNIENIVGRPEDMIGKVDAVMVVLRHGDLHLQYALPFIKEGIPTWVDKPFSIKVADALTLIEEADKRGTLLTGGSTCKYAYDVLMLKHYVDSSEEEGSIGQVQGGVLNFAATLDSEYGGLFFYGPHLAEMLMKIFGYDVDSVYARECNGNVTAIARYDRYQVAMNYLKQSNQNYGIVHGLNMSIMREIDISLIYRLGFEKFIEMLRTGKRPMPLEHLLMPTVLLNAIYKSMDSGREVNLKDIRG